MPLTRFRAKMEQAGLDAFVISQQDNRRYLAGFTGSAGFLLITLQQQYLITDSRYYEQVRRQAPAWKLVKAGYKTIEALANLLTDLHLNEAAIGFEAEYAPYQQYLQLKEAMPAVRWQDTAHFALELRAVKTPAELAAVNSAMALADEAMTHIYTWIRPGLTEKDVAWELELYMRTHGATAVSFEPIVAAGPNSALPHATPTGRTIKRGDVVLIDMGCVVDGYCSDTTRTFSLGQPHNNRYPAVWQVVAQALQAAAGGIKAGISGKAADALARDVIEAAGYGDYFGHSLGHGVGLAVHEGPRVSYAAADPLPAGSVITIEPGIYLPGEFGVRLEDMAVVTPAGATVITRSPKFDVLA